MEFRLDEGQVELRATVARFFEDRHPLDARAAREGVPTDRDAWRAMAELGVPGLLVGEDAGGSGLGVIDAAVVFEQVGAHLVPGPVVWAVLAAPLLPEVLSGEALVAGAEAPVAGAPLVVEHAIDADVLLVVHDEHVAAHRTDALGPSEPLTSLDPLATIGRLPDLPRGDEVGGSEAARRLRLVGTVLTAAELVGVATRALDVARGYALEREQFGAPIGSFQAVKHLLADMYVRTTLAQSATYAAAAVVDGPGGDDATGAARAAKLLASEAAIEGASTAVQVLGGMGFTWDMLPNHLLKRAWHLEHRFGTADDHAAHLGASLVGAAP